LLVCKDLFISQEETRKGVFHRNIWITTDANTYQTCILDAKTNSLF
jgi:hypothetical protein